MPQKKSIRFANKAQRNSRADIASLSAALVDIETRRNLASTKRMVLAGDGYELHEYERPYYYNKPPEKRRGAAATPKATHRRADNLSNARARIRRLIAANETAYGEKLKFVTFTFAKNVTSLDEANSLWGEFARRMREEFGQLKYLAVVEFQKRGAIHYHVLYFNMPYRYGIKTLLQKTWGHGWVKIVTIAHVKNVGAYVSKYLQKDILDRRLVGQKAFFCSKGLIQPIEIRSMDSIDKILASCSMQPEVTKRYTSSHFGVIHYTQGKLN